MIKVYVRICVLVQINWVKKGDETMNFMDKLENKFGRYAVYDLHKYFVFVYFIGYALDMFGGSFAYEYLSFSVPHILTGQVWRLITWVLCVDSNGIFGVIFMLCLIPMGRTLEHFLGTFRMNVYLIGGVLFNIVGGLLVYFVSSFIWVPIFSPNLSLYYILLTTFMALAICVPEATVNLYFILPIKMKWMLLIYLAELVYELYNYYKAGQAMGGYGMLILMIYGAEIVFALLNLFIFFWMSQIRLTRKQKKRQREFRQQMNTEPRPGSGITRHKCAICGMTEKDDPNLTFRYCSKCTGNKEYCNNHLFTHTHM